GARGARARALGRLARAVLLRGRVLRGRRAHADPARRRPFPQRPPHADGRCAGARAAGPRHDRGGVLLGVPPSGARRLRASLGGARRGARPCRLVRAQLRGSPGSARPEPRRRGARGSAGAARAGGGMIDALTRRWRWPLYGLLVYIPVSGLAVLAAYPGRTDRAVAILAKDFVFVIPAYALFVGYCLQHRKKFWFKVAPPVLIGLLALVVAAQAFTPNLPTPLVGLIGIKVWLFYIPLFFLGYWLVRDRAHLFTVFGVMSLVALLPAVIGLVTVVLYYTGHAQTVYNAYGDSAAPATQNFTTFVLSHGCTIRRVPSTFSFFYQYYL